MKQNLQEVQFPLDRHGIQRRKKHVVCLPPANPQAAISAHLRLISIYTSYFIPFLRPFYSMIKYGY